MKASTGAGDTGPELVIGLVGAIGVDMRMVSSALSKALETVAYQSREIHLIALVPDPKVASSSQKPVDAYYEDRMNAGNEFREKLGHKDALALLALSAIRAERLGSNGDAEQPLARRAYILRSLKTSDEVKLLREVYGPNCLVVAAHAPKPDRRTSLAQKIARSHRDANWERYMSCADELIQRDEHEQSEHGQHVRDTFWLADVFVDATAREPLEGQARRFVELLFSHPFRTPSRQEYAMFEAYGAALRSSSAGRQVGACIATRDGDVVAVGTNEVAKAFGGQYWGEDDSDHRDHLRLADSNVALTESILADLLARLRKKRWLVQEKATGLEDMLALAQRELLGRMDVEEDDPPSLADTASIKHIIEFIRAVHAEMAALMSAARRGISVEGCTLYTTSFPCHECARHIVAAGVERVVFIEPYPKSRVAYLYDDSISIDDNHDRKVPFRAFLGIAPRLYARVFEMPERKGDDGAWLDWDMVRRAQSPRQAEPFDSYVRKERDWAAYLERQLHAKDVLHATPKQA